MDATPAVQLRPLTMAKYPFLAQAAGWVRSDGPTIEDLLGKRVWARARSRGVERVQAALDAQPVAQSDAATDDAALVEVCSYVVGRLLVVAIGDKLLARRLAIAEARAAAEAAAGEDQAGLLDLAASLDVGATPAPDGTYLTPFTDLLEHTRELNALDWKLVNQTMHGGLVHLTKDKLVRLLQEAVRVRVERGLDSAAPPLVEEALADPLQELRGRVQEMRAQAVQGDFGEVRPELFPPCMRAIMESIKTGVNVSHEGRFAVVAFLHTIGVPNEGIINELFSSVPDFAKEITTYQVEHITGVNSGTEYTPPGCQTLQTFGLCPFFGRKADEWDPLCAQDWMGHPLKYYRIKKRGGGATAADAAAPDEAAP